jgi:ankyrin repeat protein
MEKGLNIAAKDNCGRTALHLAATKEEKDVVYLLLEKDSDVSAKDNKGWNASRRAKPMGMRHWRRI